MPKQTAIEIIESCLSDGSGPYFAPDVLIEILREGGYAIVPIEPTEQQADVLFRYKIDLGDMANETCYNAYRAAIGVPLKPRTAVYET